MGWIRLFQRSLSGFLAQKKEITYANACAGYLHFIKVVSVTSAPFDERGGRRSERYYRLKQFTW